MKAVEINAAEIKAEIKVVKASSDDAAVIASIIKAANQPVAEQFGINQSNNPKHPSFYTEAWARSDFERGEEYFLISADDRLVGCVAFEQASEHVGYLCRLSVLPDFQNRGVGEMLVRQVFKHAEEKSIREASIGIIAKYEELKRWYLKLGFVENGLKVFEHLPFDVLFMRFEVKSG